MSRDDVQQPNEPNVLEELDETIVVRRGEPEREPEPEPVDETIVVHRPQPVDETVVVERPDAQPEPELDDTIVTPRPDPELDATRVVHREEEGEDGVEATRVVHRPDDDDDADDADDTVIGRRSPAPAEAAPHAAVAPAVPPRTPAPRTPAPRTRRSLRAQRTPIVLPTSVSASARAAEAVGANAVDAYAPRPIPAPPAPGPDLGSGPDATRAEAPSMSSVRRSSRKAGWVVLAVIAGACVVSIGGLVGIAAVIFGG
ncbi:hypothetical protein ACFVU2_14740 [Leifsonia sp. NPDC058194]|uniref:hypothetical protein n=1 Tax=Leifsonia sp. NPDC058194 TaxID=3346374 RepID=UPI0036D95D83